MPEITINRIGTETIRVPIIGTMPLIVSNFSEKAKRQMLDSQQGRKSPKESRDPKAEYEAAFYRTPTGYGLPVVAFKASTVGAARFYGKDVKMTELRQFVFFKGSIGPNDRQSLVEIHGTEPCETHFHECAANPQMREDVVRLGGVSRSADLRYRPEFTSWSCVLEITYVKSALSRDSVLSLVDAGGMGVGVGEWRPEHRGDFGTFMIDPNIDIEVVLDAKSEAGSAG